MGPSEAFAEGFAFAVSGRVPSSPEWSSPQAQYLVSVVGELVAQMVPRRIFRRASTAVLRAADRVRSQGAG